MLFCTQRSRSVNLCGLPHRGWAVVAPRRFHFTISALRVDWSSSSRADILRTDFGKMASYDGATLSHWALLLPMLVFGDFMAVCSIWYNRCGWNSQIQSFEGVSTYVCVVYAYGNPFNLVLRTVRYNCLSSSSRIPAMHRASPHHTSINYVSEWLQQQSVPFSNGLPTC